jgi:hypothetical protein
MDIDAIPIGSNFVQVIEQRVQGSTVMLVLIGKNWLTRAEGRLAAQER